MMNIELDSELAVPLFQQLADQIRLLIARGDLRAGDSLPSTRQVASIVRANLNTVAKAYRVLAAEGIVELRRGRAARVAPQAPVQSRTIPAVAQQELNTWVAKMKMQGVKSASLHDAFFFAIANSQGEI